MSTNLEISFVVAYALVKGYIYAYEVDREVNLVEVNPHYDLALVGDSCHEFEKGS